MSPSSNGSEKPAKVCYGVCQRLHFNFAYPPPDVLDEEVARALEALLDHGPLGVAFQPIVDLWMGEPVGYEVLGRCAPVEGALASVVSSPAALLVLAHRYGRLLDLERRWRESGVRAISRLADRRYLYF